MTTGASREAGSIATGEDADSASATIAALQDRIAKLERINASLMTHVERATDQHGGAYALFQTAIILDNRVRARTEELTGLMLSLERSNAAMQAAKEEAEQANRSKTRFLAAASHDLLQPVNAARLSLSALSDLALAEPARVIAGQVERGLQTIEDLIRTLLDISRLDAGVVRPRFAATPLQPLLAEIADSFYRVADKRRLRLVLRCAPDLAIRTDAALFARVVQNLVANALSYTQEGGVLIGARRRGPDCLVEIVDTGPGIAQAEIGLIFDEFFRGSGSRGEAGLGLGLSIVRGMVDALDHTIALRSRLGRGSHFRLCAPLAAFAEVPRAAAPDDGAVGDAARVLVVENDAATRPALEQLLAGWHLVPIACRDVAAVEGCGAARPAVMLADYHLDNDATGLDAIAAARRLWGDDLPAVVVTADRSEAIDALAAANGCDILRKPVRPAQLRSLLSFLIGPA